VANLLITGGAGFIGCNFVHHWMSAHPNDRVVVLDALTYAGNLANLEPVKTQPRMRFVHGDICDHEAVAELLRSERIDMLVHFAAESHVDRSIIGPDEFVRTNVLGTHSLLRAARTVWLQERAVAQHRFHHVSTDEVFGSLGPEDPAFSERTAYAPNSPYSASKAGSDHLVRAYHHTYGLTATLTNCSNNYGPYQFPEKLIPLALVNMLDGKPVPIYGDGGNVRDWLHVHDHCRAIEQVLLRGRSGEMYNIGGRSECDNLTLVRRLCGVVDAAFRDHPDLAKRFPSCPAARSETVAGLITFVRDRPGHDRRYAIDATKVESELGFEPQTGLNAGLASTLAWYLANEPWWRGVMDGSYQRWVQAQYA
jgi:dTDP-glucose 4,6-dehydratase